MDNAFRDVPEPDDESIEKAIIEFYTRAEKHDKLVTYLISQSQTVIEKDGKYRKAVCYLKEANALSTKLNGPAVKDIKSLISERISTIEWFEYAQETYTTMDKLSLEDLCFDLMSCWRLLFIASELLLFFRAIPNCLRLPAGNAKKRV